MLGGIGLNVGREILQRLHIVKVGLGKARTQRSNRLTLLVGCAHDFVVNVGDITCINNAGVLGL